EGETVHVIGDGMEFNDAVVSNGGFTLSPPIPVSQVEVGLDYQSTGLTCEPFVSPQEGGMFVCRRWKNLGVRVRHAGPGLTVNPEGSNDIGLTIRRPDMPMDQAVLLQEGKLCAEQTNFGAFQRVYFKQTRPFPAEIIDINGELEISDEWCCDTVDENPDFGALVDTSTIFGLLIKECGHTCALGQFAQATYEGGSYAGGPAIRITDNSTNASMFGLAAIYVPDQNVLALVLYAGENLSDVGTVITSVAATLTAGDVVKIESDVVTDTTYRVLINGVTVITQSLAADTLSVVGGCVGFVKLAGVAGTITPPVGEEAMIILQVADLSKTDNTLVDTDLTLAVEANSTYVGQAALLITSVSSTPDALLQFNGPSGAVGLIFDPAWTYSTFALNTPATFSVTGGAPTVVHLDFSIRVGSTAGNITF
ncbi:MAG: hypothetical protein LUO93_12335, partial [Methanomicrobiales archaeon]|nr:hypothetical protein [Methanomicrobiales archaeon]